MTKRNQYNKIKQVIYREAKLKEKKPDLEIPYDNKEKGYVPEFRGQDYSEAITKHKSRRERESQQGSEDLFEMIERGETFEDGNDINRGTR